MEEALVILSKWWVSGRRRLRRDNEVLLAGAMKAPPRQGGQRQERAVQDAVASRASSCFRKA